MSKQVIYAQFHAGFFIPGVANGGNMKTTLTLGSVPSSFKEFKMTLEDNGMLALSWQDGGYQHAYHVAAANVIGVKEAPTKLDPKKS
jgi:hypothetical protein